MPKKFTLLTCLFLILFLQGCGSKQPAPDHPGQRSTVIADESFFPQKLSYYAKHSPKKTLLTKDEQERLKLHFDRTFFAPWSLQHGSISKKDACILKARGYTIRGDKWPQQEWDLITDNANLSTFPNLNQYGITVRNTDVRQISTHSPRYDKVIENPRDYPFDDFQYSLLPIGTPLLITHVSRDGRWYFMESALVGGWVDTSDVAFVSPDFIEYYRSKPLAAIIKDGSVLPFVGTRANIGTVLPLLATHSSSLTIGFPVKNASGFAEIRETPFDKLHASPHPLPMHVTTVAELGDQMMGQKYGWGGMYNLRDCSATTHDLLAPFGIWLPRNSRAQARQGNIIPLEGMDGATKEATIKQYGTPFLSLVGLPGHITLYVGTYKDRAAIVHNIWGLRTVEGENDNARHIIGKTIVTSLRPGAELPNLYRTRTFIDRIRALATPAK